MSWGIEMSCKMFCMKWMDHKYSNRTEFFGKILAFPIAGQKAQICPFVLNYSIFLRIGSLVSFDILHEIEGP